MPINQLATITTPEPRVINIQVWDANNVPLLDSAIKKSDLGLNPQIDGQLVRLPIPDLSEERRSEIKKVIKTMGEKCKVSIRNIRREANDASKKKLKERAKKFVTGGKDKDKKKKRVKNDAKKLCRTKSCKKAIWDGILISWGRRRRGEVPSGTGKSADISYLVYNAIGSQEN